MEHNIFGDYGKLKRVNQNDPSKLPSVNIINNLHAEIIKYNKMKEEASKDLKRDEKFYSIYQAGLFGMIPSFLSSSYITYKTIIIKEDLNLIHHDSFSAGANLVINLIADPLIFYMCAKKVKRMKPKIDNQKHHIKDLERHIRYLEQDYEKYLR